MESIMKLLKITSLYFFLAAFLATTAFAESQKGGYAGAFLNYDLSAEAMGMGGAFTAVAEGSAGIRYNPAGISEAKHLHAAFTYSSLTLDRRLNYAEVIFPLPKKAVISLSWINAGVSDVKERNSNGEIVADLKNNQNSFNLTFGRRVAQPVAVGVNVRYVQYSFAELLTTSIGIDFGVMGYFLDDDLTIGAKVANISSKYNWETANYYQTSGTTYDEKFPMLYRFGGAYRLLDKSITLAADYEGAEKGEASIHFGGEYWHFKDDVETFIDEYSGETKTRQVKLKFLSGRLGYNDGRFTIGAGARQKVGKLYLKFDYAFATGAVSGLSPDHLLTLGVGYF